MTDRSLLFTRRILLSGLGANLLAPVVAARAQTRTALALEAVAGTIDLKSGQPPTPVWQLASGPDSGPLRVRRGQTVDVTMTNRLPVPVALDWSGLDGNPLAEPWTSRPPVAPNGRETSSITFRHAGTMAVSLTTSGRPHERPRIARPVIVSETEPPVVDRDEVLLFQNWRLTSDSSAMTPGGDPKDAATIFTVNGKASFDITAKRNQRFRLRLINNCQNTVIAIKISDHDVRVMAIDGQPSEPFLARDGVVVITPGSRVDAIVDAIRPPGSTSTIALLDGRDARPIGQIITSDAKPERPEPLSMSLSLSLPSNDLPALLDLKSALRLDLLLGTADWLEEAVLTPKTPPAFKVKKGRTTVLALTNRDTTPMVFHLHGHHFRLLDRLDDGWKPFWLDTLAVGPGKTQRIAFAAEFPGLYPMQAAATDWAARRRLRSYLVE